MSRRLMLRFTILHRNSWLLLALSDIVGALRKLECITKGIMGFNKNLTICNLYKTFSLSSLSSLSATPLEQRQDTVTRPFHHENAQASFPHEH